jgi:hypothetical protein
MAVITIDKFNLNQFYEKTPTFLKYILVISLIVVGSYYLFSNKISKGQDKQLDKIEETIETAYTIIDQFDNFEKAQYRWNEDIMKYLKNIYILIEELNESTNRKFDLLLATNKGSTSEILERLILLNESFEKLQYAYTPDEFIQPQQSIPDPRIKQKNVFNPALIPIDNDGNSLGDTIYMKKNEEANEW